MTTEVLTALISAVTTLLVSMGTWNVTLRQYRAKNEDMVKKAISDVKDTVTQNNAEIQEHLSIIDLKVETLSNRVDKHNNLVERTYQLESDVKLNTSEINHLKERVG